MGGMYTEHPRARGENNSMVVDGDKIKGTSPRTRGKHLGGEDSAGAGGNIPAHAGKTSMTSINAGNREEHPRARGENSTDEMIAATEDGTSPRTRGKQGGVDDRHENLRNIPAHAGKTG